MKSLYSIILLLLFSVSVSGIDIKDTRMMSQPTVSDTHVAFIYAEDLWVANIDGSNPRRLTVDEGIESLPVFSPDGKLIAFSAQYDGNIDVFTIPVEGGVPTRLTWHPGADLSRGFMPDGKQVIFASQRTVFTTRYHQLFTVSINGGYPTQVELPNAWNGSFSPDGKKMLTHPSHHNTNNGNIIAGALSLRYGFSPPMIKVQSKFRNPRKAATTLTPCGSATLFTFAATAMENSIFSLMM